MGTGERLDFQIDLTFEQVGINVMAREGSGFTGIGETNTKSILYPILVSMVPLSEITM